MANGLLAYIGTYTIRGSEGIYVYRMDAVTGGLDYLSKTVGMSNPSFLAIHPQRRYLYAVNEVAQFEGKASGAVSAFSINAQTGELRYLNQKHSHGTSPCHVAVEPDGRFVLVANYSSGSACILPIGSDGQLGEATEVVQHHGSSANPDRQEGPHAHSANLDPSGRHVLIADLGLDRIMLYRLDPAGGRLVPHTQPWASLKPGAGPRHLAFHPSGHYVYVINELDSTMTVFAYDAERGGLKELQTISTLPQGFQGTSYCADVHVSPSGRFVYSSNRGHDSIAIFGIDEATGKLSCVGHEPTLGRTPRNFAIDPSGTFLLAANQDTDTIVTFRMDQQTGRLTPTGQVASVSMPVCILLVPFP